ncbi:FecR family protein [Flavisphingomonas formosensis]|uniref:FecR family protein n=1 Tax=Flavisphingomonas formosensis TaxID=861534 RepID=UPI0018DFE330|nr:FecR domain-containing protein [Sphingomonas formosensis]
MTWTGFGWLTSKARNERQAIHWLAEMSNDPEAAGPGLAQWLAGDPRRRPVYERLSRELDAMSAAGATLTRPERRQRAAPAPRSLPRATLIFAVCLVLALGAMLALREAEFGHQRTPPSLSASSGEEQRFGTAIGEVRRIRLADGSTVLLDGDSVLTVSFQPSKRVLTLLNGRARFDVAHDPSRPFVVAAAGGTVTAVGTMFDVWVRPDRQVKVVLLRGAVDVLMPGQIAKKTGRPLRLAPDQRVLYSSGALDAHARPIPVAATAAESNWMNETIDFDYVPLRDVLLEANRHSSYQIALADPALGDIEVFGTFRLKDTVRLAEKLAQSLELDLAADGKRLVLSARTSHRQK